MITIDAHTHLGFDFYADSWSDEGTLSSANRYANIQRQNGVDRGFAFTTVSLTQDAAEGNNQ